MKGILLVNMGGAENLAGMKDFLTRMFRDPKILPMNVLSRYMLSYIITTKRYKKSWAKYELIGGTPIIKDTVKTAELLQHKLGNNSKVKFAFSYTKPLVVNALEEFYSEGITSVQVIPLYPHNSETTTGSVKADCAIFQKKYPKTELSIVEDFHANTLFIKFWTEAIQQYIQTKNIEKPFLIFSAHSIPKVWIKKGDLYADQIKASAKLIANELQLDYFVSFQSALDKVHWVGPDTLDALELLASKPERPILLVPISFVGENLETLYDYGHDMLPFARKDLGLQNISAVPVATNSETFIQLLQNLIIVQHGK